MIRRLLLLLLLSLALSAPLAAQEVAEPILDGTILAAPPVIPLVLPPPVAQPTLVLRNPPEAPLPPAIRAMIELSMESGDRKATETVLQVARKAAPRGHAGIDALEGAWKRELAANDARAAAERVQRLRAAGFLDYWGGQLELGASRSTGNNRNLGVVGSLNLQREGLDWRHRVYGRAELQRTNGETTADRAIASWQPNYKFSERAYASGLAQFERDRFAGYSQRYTAGLGIGYSLFTGPRLRLDVEGGPAYRHTKEIDEVDSSRIVGRGSLNLRWQISPTLLLTQNSALFLEEGDTNATATTALDTTLIGALKARFSYDVQYESDVPVGARNLNTQSRASFVYAF